MKCRAGDDAMQMEIEGARIVERKKAKEHMNEPRTGINSGKNKVKKGGRKKEEK